MAEARTRLDWLRTSTAVARVINAFRRPGSKCLADDYLVPEPLRDQKRAADEGDRAPPFKLPVDVLVEIFCKPRK